MPKRKTQIKKNIIETGKLVAAVAVITTASMLEMLLDLTNSLCEIALDRKAVYRSVYRRFPATDDSHIAHQIYQLKSRGYIKYGSDNQAIILTGKTRIKTLEYQSEKIMRDDKFRFLTFDIPKEKNYARDQFRRAIKRMGFVKIQQSLWVTDKDLSEMVELAAYEYKVENFVAYIISERSDIDGLVKKSLAKTRSKNISPKNTRMQKA